VRRYNLTVLLIACTLSTLPGSAAAEGTPSALTIADYLEYEQVADPQLSPDGKTVIYTRRWIDRRNDSWESSLWIAGADGSRSRFLIEGSNARWSPSGDRILFIAPDEHRKPQIFTRWMDAEGAVTQITRGEVRPNSPTWSPDGRHIAFVAVVPAAEEFAIPLPKPPEGATWTKTPRVLDRLHYRQDFVGFVDPGFSHLFVVPAEAGSARQLTTGTWHVGAQFDGLFLGAGLDWTPDGRNILFDGWNEPDGDLAYRRSHIYSIDIDTARTTRLTSEIGFWSDPKISGDGKAIVYLGYPTTNKTYELPRLHVMRRDGSGARQLSADFDRPVSDVIWEANHRGVFFTAEDAGYINVFHMDLEGKVRRVTSGQHTLTLNSTDSGTKFGVGVRADFREPGDIHRIALDRTGGIERLTRVNDDLLGRKVLGAQEEIWFTAADGSRAHGWIVKPPDFDPARRYPLIMEIHGGPFAMYRGQFDFMYQLFATSGYVVLYTNPRGSTGYGEAFSQAIDRAYPSVDHLDLMAGVDAVVARGYIDTDRLYVGGCSGGGVLSSWMIGHTDRFAAAAVRCPVSNWLSMAGTTDIPGFTHSFFDKPFWVDPEKWLHHSPLMHVGKVTTPTIIMTGEQDLRTPMAQSEEYYAALKMRGVPAKLIRFNDQYHGTGTRPSNWMRTVLYMTEWYGQWTEKGQKSKETAAPANP
jgi:dipeptidyl aminopeptidase/acylaminoacyl peptidase